MKKMKKIFILLVITLLITTFFSTFSTPALKVKKSNNNSNGGKIWGSTTIFYIAVANVTVEAIGQVNGEYDKYITDCTGRYYFEFDTNDIYEVTATSTDFGSITKEVIVDGSKDIYWCDFDFFYDKGRIRTIDIFQLFFSNFFSFN